VATISIGFPDLRWARTIICPSRFNPRELPARINAVLRRQTASAIKGPTMLNFLGWRIDFRLRELRNPMGARVAMSSAEFDLLRVFCERPGRVLSRDSLLDLTQGRNSGSFERQASMCWSAAFGARSGPIRRLLP